MSIPLPHQRGLRNGQIAGWLLEQADHSRKTINEEAMKTLGQIAYKAAMDIPDFDDRWEAAAQAVREAVIEECAEHFERMVENQLSSSQAENVRLVVKAIRALKDKK